MIASVLQESGYKVGLYTSPHLKDFRERIKINGETIPKKNVIDFIVLHQDFLEKQKLSFFELTVGMAFDYFADQQVDIAVIEVGLGGRLDSTNIINPLVTVITNIGYDHTQFLGNSLPEIAYEKAGIIKPSVPVVIGEKNQETLKVFKKIGSENNATLYFSEDLIIKNHSTDLLGDYQDQNVRTAVQTLSLLTQKNFIISDKDIGIGLQQVVKNTGLQGRWQILGTRPKIICDTAHNKEGLSIVMHQLNQEKYKKLHLVLGMVNDKNLDSILPLFPKNASYYFCKPNIPRGLNANLLKQAAFKYQLHGKVYKSVMDAFQNAVDLAGEDDVIYVGGSTFVVGELPL